MSTDYTGHHEPTPYVHERDAFEVDLKPAAGGSDPYSEEAQAALDSEGGRLSDSQVDAVLAEAGWLSAGARTPGYVTTPWKSPVSEVTRLTRRPEVAGSTPAEDEAWVAVE